jgi:hypothetical protein
MRFLMCAALVLMTVPAIPIASTAAPDLKRMGRVEFDLTCNVGGIASVGTREPTGNGAGAIDLWLTWRTGRHVRLGLRVGLIVGAMQWGKDRYAGDAWVPGFKLLDDYGWRTTLLPHSGVVFAIDLPRGFALDLGWGIGGTLVGSRDKDGGVLFPPCVILGVGTTYELATLDHAVVALAIRLDYVASWLVRSQGTFAPQAGVQFRF